MVRGGYIEISNLCQVIFLLIYHTTGWVVHATSNGTSLGIIQNETKLLYSRERRLTTYGLMICACSCILSDSCASFNFQKSDGQCEINSKASTSELQYAPGYVYSAISNWPDILSPMCKRTIGSTNNSASKLDCIKQGCSTSEIPVIAHATMKHQVSVPVSPVGTVLEYNCGVNFTSHVYSTCKNNGNWTSDDCVPLQPGCCKEIKETIPGSEDGEYWLSLKSFNLTTTKIYCHNMNTDHPEEFLTLLYDNYGISPKIQRVRWGRTRTIKRGGEVWFQKVKLNITDMSVNRTDRTFATVNTTIVKIYYAEAHDCFSWHLQGKVGIFGTVGEFHIDLRGTGWRVHPDQQWVPMGYKPAIESVLREHNGSVIHLKCGGHCGHCAPSGKLLLVENLDGDTR